MTRIAAAACELGAAARAVGCAAAEDVARDMGIPVEEMLAVAREQWLLPDGSTRTFLIPEAVEALDVERPVALTVS